MQGGKFAKQFDEDRLKVIPVKISPFKMYDCGGMYPAVTQGGDMDKDYIHAELHVYKNPKSVVKRMKQVEGNLYTFTQLKNVKETITFRLPGKKHRSKKFPVWMFLWNLKTEGKKQIYHGDWKRFTEDRNKRQRPIRRRK